VSLVVFPFKTERPEVLLENIRIAASHPRIERVLCVGYEEEETYNSVENASTEIASDTGTPIELMVQERLGTKRPGKGDGMNTALTYFLEQTDLERIHFYDADITSFGPEWITKAEQAADFDYGVVRHYFPRASTDAMITWLITRTGFALLFPRSELPWIEQPLGGELLFKRYVVERLVGDERVMAQSDWGIDTLYTFAVAQQGIPMFESYVRAGKAHALYGRLADLRTMLIECFSAIQGLQDEAMDGTLIHRIEYPDVVPHAIAEKIGFDFESSTSLLPEQWTEGIVDLLELFPVPVRDGLYANRTGHPVYGFMGRDDWYDSYLVFLDHFVFGDHDWEQLLFKAWTCRVLHYTATAAVRGYSYATRYLHAMVARYMRLSVFGR
jgi:mannosylglycerate synthase